MDEDRLKHQVAVARKMVEIAQSKIGGEILKKSNFKYWKEVYYHGEVNIEYESAYLTILNQADMQIDKYGNDVGYEKRLEDIQNRYGTNSKTYKTCCKLVDKIRNQ